MNFISIDEKSIRYIKFFGYKYKVLAIVIVFLLSGSLICHAQQKTINDTAKYFNLDQCIVYALKHQPSVMQSDIGIAIARKTNAINLSGWLPTHYGGYLRKNGC